MDTGVLLQRLPQNLFTHAIVLGDNGSQTHAPLTPVLRARRSSL